MFTEDIMNAFAVTLFCRPNHIPGFANSRKCLWLRRGCNYFMFKQKLLERKEQNFGVIREFLNVDLTDSQKDHTCRMSMSFFKKAT